jgi:hypothetical protein
MTDNLPPHQKSKNIILAIRLLWGSLVLGALGSALNWDFTLSQMPPDFPMNKDLFGFLVILFTFTIMAWMVFKISSGRNWARILFLVMFMIGVPLSIPSLTISYHYSKAVFLITIINSGLQLMVVYFLFSKAGNAWFKAQKELKKKN